MIAAQLFRGRHVGVFGLARTGISSARALLAGGANVVAWDDSERARASAQDAGVPLSDWRQWRMEGMAAVMLAPGVPLTHPEPHGVVQAAQRAGVEILGDVALFARELAAGGQRSRQGGRPACPLVCVTGTNGKSTTTALIGHLLQRAGYGAEVGGNIGRAVFDLAPPAPHRAYAIEVSSFQIDLAPDLRPDVALLLNITPDHLDRHGSMANYVAIKRRLFAHQQPGDVAVVGIDDAYGADTCAMLNARGGPSVIPVSVGKALSHGVYVLDGVLYDAMSTPAVAIADLKACPTLPGPHNWQNAAAAYAAVRGLVADTRETARAMASFPGLAHRIERAGQVGEVLFVNDSKATNAEAAEKALACFPRVYWIAGGVPKSGGIEPLKPLFPRIAKAYLIGQAAPAFAETLGDAVAYDLSGDLETAMRRALADARRSGEAAPVVLLSPACASFDQFRDYEQRGDRFKALVTQLQAEIAEGRA